MDTLDTTYVSEKEELESKKSTKRVLQTLENKYIDNKAALESEFNRIKGIVASVDRGVTILESDFRTIFSELDENISFQAGPRALHTMLKTLDIKQEIDKNLKEFASIKSVEKRKKTFTLIKLLISLYSSKVRPENMIISKLPVIPPDLRPVVQLDG